MPERPPAIQVASEPVAQGSERTAGAAPDLLSVRNVSKSFGGLRVLTDISFEVHDGEVMAVMGPNGAGKTTAINIITGVTNPDAGGVVLRERALTGLTVSSRARLGIGRTFQHPAVLTNLTIRENVLLGGAWRRRQGDAERRSGRYPHRRALVKEAERILDWVGVPKSHWERRPAELTFISQRYVELARALMLKPSLLLLDEPAAGMTEDELRALSRLIRALTSELKLGIALVEHNIDFITDTADKAVVIDAGYVIFDGTPHGAVRDSAVKSAYLGVDDDEVS